MCCMKRRMLLRLAILPLSSEDRNQSGDFVDFLGPDTETLTWTVEVSEAGGLRRRHPLRARHQQACASDGALAQRQSRRDAALRAQQPSGGKCLGAAVDDAPAQRRRQHDHPDRAGRRCAEPRPSAHHQGGADAVRAGLCGDRRQWPHRARDAATARRTSSTAARSSSTSPSTTTASTSSTPQPTPMRRTARA